MSFFPSKALTLFFLIVAASPVSFANPAGKVDAPITFSSEKITQLANSQQWRLLLGYRNSSTSKITSDDFFISEKGKFDPEDELKKTLDDFLAPITDDDDNDHAQCRYRGRYFWLEKQLGLDQYTIPKPDCTDYKAFAGTDQPLISNSVSLVYATGYLGNPASYYGHLLFKINRKALNSISSNSLRSTAINYGARIPDNENMVLYILKGISGSYSSTFTEKEFYYHLHNYTEGELRDLWEYELSLDPEAQQLLSGHAWEMLGQTHDYYFTNRNCAYRIAELLELVTDQPLTEAWRPWEAPQAIVQAIEKAERHGRPIVKAIKYIPSKQSKLYKKFVQLNTQEKSAVRSAVEAALPESSLFASLNTNAKIRVLDVLLDYYRVIIPHDQVLNNEEYLKALAQRYALPPGKPEFKTHSSTTPHVGHSPSYTAIGLTNNSSLGQGTSLRIRPVYYDQLDSGYGHIKGSSLSMLDVIFSEYNSKLELEKLDLLLIENFYSFSTKLPGDKKAAWTLRIGAEKTDNQCTDCLGYIAYAGRGSAYSFKSGRILLNLMVHAGIKGESDTSNALFVEAKMGNNMTMSKHLGILSEISRKEFVNSGHTTEEYKLSLRYQLSPDLDVRLVAHKNESTVIQLSAGWYW